MEKSGNEVTSTDFESDCNYRIQCVVLHSKLLAEDISAALGAEPDYCWNVGDKFGKRKVLRRGKTSWTRELQKKGSRHFFRDTAMVYTWLAQRAEAVRELIRRGAEIRVEIGISGPANIGDVLDVETMRIASDLGVPIGLEYFPVVQDW